ncbi:MAG: hypothetical protein WKF62_01660 [Solirubrobacterales bacterium]
MPDPQQVPEPSDMSTTLGASLNSVWNRYADTAPTDASVELEAGVVRWSVPKASADQLKEGIASRDGQDGTPVRTMASFQRETSAVVAKAMHRKITARFTKKIKDDVSTEVFILENLPRKN